MGNHEAMLLRFLSEPATLTDWIRFGGLETLRSYGVTPTLPLDAASVARTAAAAAERIPPEHIAFLRGMLLAWTCGPMTFVHAGLRPGRILAEQDARDMLEIREPFLSHAGSHGTYVVHGHTPVRELDVRPNRLNLDTGAFATGTLTGAIISRGSMYRLTAKAPRASA
jgi:serine/threonine protein phosphatase 1